jgi:hypothetical protein
MRLTFIRTAVPAVLVAASFAVATVAQAAPNPYQPSPIVKTGQATDIEVGTAVLNGSVNPNGAATTYWFEYGTTKSYGSQTNAQSLLAGNHTVDVSAEITGLAPNTVYHFRLVAFNSGGSAAGVDHRFTTEQKEHPRLTLHSNPRFAHPAPWRFTFFGTLLLPQTVDRSEGCQGVIRIQIRSHGILVKTAHTQLGDQCHYSFNHLKIPRGTSTGKIRVTTTFEGNSALWAASSGVLVDKIGR